MYILSILVSVFRADVIQKYFSALVILTLLVVTAGIITYLEPASSTKIQPKPHLSAETVFHPKSVDFINTDKFATKSSRMFSSKLFRELFSMADVKPLTFFVNSPVEILSGTKKSSSYISIFASLPLRSPPYFLIWL